MSRGLDDGNWKWHGKVALSPTTFFISVWAPTDSRLSRTEGEEERERCQTGTITRSKLETRGGCCRYGNKTAPIEETETEETQ